MNYLFSELNQKMKPEPTVGDTTLIFSQTKPSFYVSAF